MPQKILQEQQEQHDQDNEDRDRDNKKRFRDYILGKEEKEGPGEEKAQREGEAKVEPEQEAAKPVAYRSEWRLPAEQAEFALMNEEDERQVVLEQLGRAPEQYVYVYRKGGKLVAGVSVAGAKDLAKTKGFIELLLPVDCHLEEGADGEMYYHAGVRAKDLRKNVIFPGFGRHWAMMRLKTGDVVIDDLAWNKALGKAERNALLSLLPRTDIDAYIEEHLPEIVKKKGIKDIREIRD